MKSEEGVFTRFYLFLTVNKNSFDKKKGSNTGKHDKKF